MDASLQPPILPNILELLGRLRVEDPPLKDLPRGRFIDFGDSEFEAVAWNGRFTYVPTEALHHPDRTQRSFMYRGQTMRHHPCLPLLLRGVDLKDMHQLRARILLERVRTAELELVLREHPFTQVAQRWGMNVDYRGLAQHYGIPTAALDLTSNAEVAAFFAVAKVTLEGQFVPMEKGVGVVYRFDWTAFGPGYSRAFQPVGFGPGLRPARQHAFVFTPHPGQDFETIPYVEAIEFRHDAGASKRVFEMFANGEHLYPADCLASLVQKLRGLPFVTMHAIRHAARKDGQPEERIERAAESAAIQLNTIVGLEVVDGHELALEYEDIDRARQQAPTLAERIQAMRKGFRLTRTRKE